MLKYLSSEEDLKNGYHLSEVLTSTIFVAGFNEIHEDFAVGRTETLSKDPNEGQRCVRLCEENRDEYFIQNYTSLFSMTESINLKLTFYRSQLFLSSLGRLHKLYSMSNFDVVAKLYDIGFLSKKQQHMICFMLSVSCMVRYKVYMRKDSQDDLTRTNTGRTFWDISSMHEVMTAVGDKAVSDFFHILWKCHGFIKHLNEGGKVTPWKTIPDDPLSSLANKMTILTNLNLHDMVSKEYQSVRNILSSERESSKVDIEQEVNILCCAIEAMNRQGNDKQLIICCDQLVNLRLHDPVKEVTNLHFVANYLNNPPQKFYKVQMALSHLNSALKKIERYQSHFSRLGPDQKFYKSPLYYAFQTYKIVGGTHIHLGNYKQADSYLQKALEISASHEVEFEKDVRLVFERLSLLEYLGQCKLSMNQESILYFDKALALARKHRPFDLEQQGTPLFHKSWALFIDGRVEEALVCLNEVTDLYKKNDLEAKVSDEIAYFTQHKESAIDDLWKDKQHRIYNRICKVTYRGRSTLNEAVEYVTNR